MSLGKCAALATPQGIDLRGTRTSSVIEQLAEASTLEKVNLMGTSVAELWPLLSTVSTLRWLGVPRATNDAALAPFHQQNAKLVIRKGDGP